MRKVLNMTSVKRKEKQRVSFARMRDVCFEGEVGTYGINSAHEKTRLNIDHLFRSDARIAQNRERKVDVIIDQSALASLMLHNALVRQLFRNTRKRIRNR